MLKILRNKKTAKKIWIALGIIILPAFVFWGFSGALSDRKNQEILGKINGKKISGEDFRESLHAVRSLALMQYGEKLPEVEKELNLEAQAWQRILLLFEAKKQKITASDKEVIKLIQAFPFFQYKGEFNDKIYNEVLKNIFRTQPRIFEEEIRQNIIISKLYRKVTEGITVNDDEIKEGYIKTNSANNSKFKFDEKKFLEEREEFKKAILEEKKQKYFLSYTSDLLK